jgi:predicted DCC family thiol-disulfide oxidoreductase YuxK
MTTARTTPPGKYVLIYDGLCKFCTAGSRHFVRWMGPVEVELLDFQRPGALDRFPGLTHDDCMKAMQLVTPDGRLYHGFEAAVRAFATRRVVGRLAYAYYLPGLRQLLDWLYARVAANRYRIMGKAVAAGECEGGTCALHLPTAENPKSQIPNLKEIQNPKAQ